ncbi:putative peptidase S9, serine active, alpha/Beta hydrolase [Lupinus albus]|uniref:Putative peptidase S9, serine active, alpha/Beta hydrolase n=1 Tax=Lupinus albus TaxID=3870 RepID=A0A6A4QZS3_LUPAL|nr:putative peptidase S9, serine active, alpha/Beta hydrolase [Lupinus albus]
MQHILVHLQRHCFFSPYMATIQSDLLLSAFYKHASSTFRSFPRATACRLLFPSPRPPLRLRAFSTAAADSTVVKVPDKPSVCTADELHYVSVNNSDWRVALWRYHPCPQAPPRNHPLLLLSGVGTNAIGYDLSPGSSFARYMSGQGFETWILEVRGAGLSLRGSNSKDIEQSANTVSEKMESLSENATTVQGSNSKDVEQSAHAISENMEAASESATNGPVTSKKELNSISCAESEISAAQGVEDENVAVKGDLTGLASVWDESKLVTRLTETFLRLSERVSGFLSENQSKVMSANLLDRISKLLAGSPLYEQFNDIRGNLSTLLETRENSSITSQITELSQKLVNIIEEAQLSIVTPPLFDLQTRFSSTVDDFQKQLDLMVNYDWDFDHYLEEDVPAAIEYIMKESKPKDGKLLAVGHSMGGILLYSMLSRFGFDGKEPRLAAVVTLASSLDYTSSNSYLKSLIPLADPAQALNVPVPLGALLAAAHPLSSSPPYVLSWLNSLISAEDMMDPDLLKRLVLNNFCTIPTKLLLQLTTAFREGGLCNRDGTFFYKDHLHKINVPILAIAGDQDLICPPEAVEETAKLIPEQLVTYKVFGEPGGPHYAHYDLVGGRVAVEQVYPCIIEFLTCHDK